jgi:hypothetical protein
MDLKWPSDPRDAEIERLRGEREKLAKALIKTWGVLEPICPWGSKDKIMIEHAEALEIARRIAMDGTKPMPSNAAGEWHKFDAEDKATWPEKPGRYLVWCVGNYSSMDDWNELDGWFMYNVAQWAEILPPESRGE